MDITEKRFPDGSVASIPSDAGVENCAVAVSVELATAPATPVAAAVEPRCSPKTTSQSLQVKT
jgi:hypothetical protein